MSHMPEKEQPQAVARILAVDDDEGIRMTYRQMLTKAGYQVQTASNGEEALSLLQKQSYDLVLLDLNMPKMDGKEFMKRWRRLKRRPEVLVISSYATVENTVEVVKLGAFDVAQKPCLSGDLLPRVERILAHRREPVVEYIRANFATIRSRGEVARYFTISPETVSNRVRRCTDQSFHDFLGTCRVQEAQRMLAETEMEAKQIAMRIGFCSYHTFARTLLRPPLPGNGHHTTGRSTLYKPAFCLDNPDHLSVKP